MTSATSLAKLEILYFDGCPSYERLLKHLPCLLEREGLRANIVARSIVDADAALRERFLGSPTVRVNGRDIEPGASEREDYGLKCRIYRTSTGLSGNPADRWIIDALTS